MSPLIEKLLSLIFVMRLRAVKSTFSVGALLVCVFIIVTNFCLYSTNCSSKKIAFKSSIIASLERLSFQGGFLDYKENVIELPGGLNQHIWENNSVKTIETLCNFPVFPNAPDQRQVISQTEITAPNDAGTDGHRLFGFVLPNSTGEYQFAVASNGFAEIWLSLSKNWRAAKQIATVRPFDVQSPAKWNFNTSKTQISSRIHLNANVEYYIEILYTLGARDKSEKFLQVAWRGPQESTFKIMGSEFLLLFKNDSDKGRYKMFDDELPHALSCATKHEKDSENKHMRPETIPYLEHTAVSKALQFCEYRPSYLLDPANVKGFRRYRGVLNHAHKTHSFPLPNVAGVRNEPGGNDFSCYYPWDEEEARSVVTRYMNALDKSYSG